MSKYLWTIGFFALLLEIFSVLPTRPKAQTTESSQFIQGIIHVHSNYSTDGGGSVEEIAEAAKAADLDFVVITDHNTIDGRRDGKEGTYDGVDTFIEMESSVPPGHLLTFYALTPAAALPNNDLVDLSWKHYMGWEKPENGFMIVAHPSNRKNPWSRLDRYPRGTEVMNFDSVWQRSLFDSPVGFALTAMLIPFNPFLSTLRFFEYYPKDISAWDTKLSVAPPHVGILGTDAHQRLILKKDLYLPWPDYRSTFKIASNLAFVPKPLPKSFEARRRVLYDAIKSGSIAIALNALYPPEGSDWTYTCSNSKQEFRVGSQPKLGNQCRFNIQLPDNFPYKSLAKLYKNGTLETEVELNGNFVSIPVNEAGTYRLEVWAHAHSVFRILLSHDVPYLMYNPIFVGPNGA